MPKYSVKLPCYTKYILNIIVDADNLDEAEDKALEIFYNTELTQKLRNLELPVYIDFDEMDIKEEKE